MQRFLWIGLKALFLVGALGAISACQPLTNLLSSAPKTGQGDSGAAIAAPKPATLALARHLKATKATMYGAHWCPYCHKQRDLFGESTFKAHINYVECAEDGANANPKLCRDKQVQGFPTWEINGKMHAGMQSLNELADLSGYQGSRDF
jgi:glutaredoxin